MLSACGPLRPCVTSNSTRWFSSRLRNPEAAIAEKWAKTSSPPSSGLMKPKPLSALNHLTVPVAILLLSGGRCRNPHRAGPPVAVMITPVRRAFIGYHNCNAATVPDICPTRPWIDLLLNCKIDVSSSWRGTVDARTAGTAPSGQPEGDHVLGRPRCLRLAGPARRTGAVDRPGRGLPRGAPGRARGDRRAGRRPRDGHAAVALPGAPLGGHRPGGLHPVRLAQPGAADRAGVPDPDRRHRTGAVRAGVRPEQRHGDDRVGRRPAEDPRTGPGHRRAPRRRADHEHAGRTGGRDVTAVSTGPETGPADSGGAGVEVRTDGWRRLSPRMLAVHPVQELPRALPALVGAFAVGQSRGNGQLWSLAGVGIVVGLAILRWFTTSYKITDEQVQVRRGLLRRRVLSVPRDRVRTVDVTSHALHRVLGLARVTVGTGQSDRKSDRGLRLDGLSTAVAARLHEELLHRSPPAAAPAADGAAPAVLERPAETELAVLRPAWFRYAPFSLSGLVSIGVVTGFVWRAANEAHVNVFHFGPLRAFGGHLSRVPVGL